MKAEGKNPRKPLIRRDTATGQQVAGFLDIETGTFETVMEIHDERDIDEFLEKYNVSLVMISKC